MLALYWWAMTKECTIYNILISHGVYWSIWHSIGYSCQIISLIWSTCLRYWIFSEKTFQYWKWTTRFFSYYGSYLQLPSTQGWTRIETNSCLFNECMELFHLISLDTLYFFFFWNALCDNSVSLFNVVLACTLLGRVSASLSTCKLRGALALSLKE